MAPENRRRILLLAVLVLTLWATWQVSTDPADPAGLAESTSRAKPRSSKPVVSAEVSSLEWPQRTSEEQPVKDLFGAATQPSAVNPAVLPAATLSAPPAPQAPFTVRYIGQVEDSGVSQVFLTDPQNQLHSALAGKTLIDGWQLLSMTPQELLFRHLATGQEQTLTIGTL